MVVEMQRFLIAMDYKDLQELILSLVIYFSQLTYSFGVQIGGMARCCVEKLTHKVWSTDPYAVLGGRGKSGTVTQAAEYSRAVLGSITNIPP